MVFDECPIVLRDGTAVTLRSPRQQDIAAYTAFRREAATQSHDLLRYPEEYDSIENRESKSIEEAAGDPSAIMISAFAGGLLVGNVGVRCVYDVIKTRHRAELSIAILKRYCGIGLGTRLISEAMDATRAMGYCQLELGVFADNNAAISLYKKFGFSEYGRMPNAFRLKDGTYIADVTMMVPLSVSDHDLA